MKEPEKIECCNCGWEGQRDYLEDGLTNAKSCDNFHNFRTNE